VSNSELQSVLNEAKAIAQAAEDEGRDFYPGEAEQVRGLLQQADGIKKSGGTNPTRVNQPPEWFQAEVDWLAAGAKAAGLDDGPSVADPNARLKGGTWGAAVLRKLGSAGGRKDLVSSGSIVPPPAFDPNILRSPEKPLFVRQLIPTRTMTDTSSKFTFMRQTTRDSQATTVAPGGTKPTSTYTIEAVTEDIRVIAHLSEAVDRSQLSDASFLRDFLEAELRLGLMEAEENQVLNGLGPGFGEFAGLMSDEDTQSQTFSSDIFTTTRKALTKLEDVYMQPDGFVFNQADWEAVDLAQDDNHRFMNDQAPVNRARRTLWGVPVISSPNMPPGTGLLGAFAEGCFIMDREAPRLDWSENIVEDGVSDFTKNKIRFRAEERLGFAVTRPFAFCTIALS
jgi:HK97 family phage major capsid protein